MHEIKYFSIQRIHSATYQVKAKVLNWCATLLTTNPNNRRQATLDTKAAPRSAQTQPASSKTAWPRGEVRSHQINAIEEGFALLVSGWILTQIFTSSSGW